MIRRILGWFTAPPRVQRNILYFSDLTPDGSVLRAVIEERPDGYGRILELDWV